MAICKSYIKNPDALRFQKELFARTFGKHFTILSRLTQCVCQIRNETPQWFKDAHERALQLVKFWESCQVEILGSLNTVSVSY